MASVYVEHQGQIPPDNMHDGVNSSFQSSLTDIDIMA